MKKFFFILFTWLCLFLVFELATRGYVSIRKRVGGQTKRVTNQVSMYRPHPFSAYVPNPAYPDHSARGFRETRPHPAEPATWFRLACFGGSSTYGTRVLSEDSYPAQLEASLESEFGAGIEVINAGVAGYTTAHIIPWLALHVAHTRPHVAIFYVGFNDIWKRLMYAGFQTDYTHAVTAWRLPALPIWRRSLFLDRMAHRLGFHSPRNPHINMVCGTAPSGEAQDNWAHSNDRAFRSNLLTLAGICRAHRIEPVFCIQAYDAENHPREDNAMWAKAMDAYGDLIKDLTGLHGVHVVELRDQMNNQELFFADFIHMTTEGNRRRSEQIAAYLKEAGLIPIQPDGTDGAEMPARHATGT